MFNLISKNTVFLSLYKFKEPVLKLSKELKCSFFLLKKKVFVNSEILITCEKSLKDKDVFFVHSTENPVNETIMELLITLEIIRDLKPKSISLILPFLAYGRQDKKKNFSEPITFKMLVKLIESFGIKNIITFDLHSKKTEKFFNSNLINLSFSNILLKKILKKNIKNLSLVAPDLGKKQQLENLSKKLNIPIIQIYKKRPKDNQTIVVNIEGEVKDRNLIFIDDMIDTGNTILNSIKLLKNKGAKDIFVLSTHGIFSNNSIEKFSNNYKNGIIKEILISDTILQKTNLCLNIVTIFDYLTIFFKKVTNKKTLNIFLQNEEDWLVKNEQ